MLIGLSRKHPIGLFIILLLNVEQYSSEEDIGTLNFDVFQETSGEGVCPKLVNPENGRYACTETHGLGVSPRLEGNKTCILKCNEGFVLPIIPNTSDGKPMLLENIGIYKCFSDPQDAGNLREWAPKRFFECIPIRHPTECRQYFYLTLATKDDKCSPNSAATQEKHLRGSGSQFVTPYVCWAQDVKCSWDYHVRCNQDNTLWLVTVIMSWAFNDQFLKIQDLLKQSFTLDMKHIRLQDQKNSPTKLDKNPGALNFRLMCPHGTRFSRDFLCHGCTKGNFMNELIMECQPCPPRFFQDKDLQRTCKPCPVGSTGSGKGGAHVTSCYKMDELLQETDLLTMMFCLSTVVSFIFALIIFNNETHKEKLKEEMMAAASKAEGEAGKNASKEMPFQMSGMSKSCRQSAFSRYTIRESNVDYVPWPRSSGGTRSDASGADDVPHRHHSIRSGDSYETSYTLASGTSSHYDYSSDEV